MKRILTFTVVIMLSAVYACSSSKDTANNDGKNANNKTEVASKRNSGKADGQTMTPEQKKEFDKKIRESAEKNKQLEKEAKKKKKEQEKEAKRKQKEQEKLISEASKNERKRIEEERKKEREALKSSIKNYDPNVEDGGTYVPDNNVTISKNANDTSAIKDLESLLSSAESDSLSTLVDVPEEDGYEPEVLKSAKGKASDIKKALKEERKRKQARFDSLPAVDKIIYLTDEKRAEGDDATKKKNFISKQIDEMFPEHVDRDYTYDLFYDQHPRSIMILYPWNRSQYANASNLLLITATKELTSKGYYVPSAVSVMDMYKDDTTFSSQYVKPSDLHRLRQQYGCDAFMFVTIYRFDSPSWSTQTKTVAHYTLVSASTLDTIFIRQAEFTYDTPIPPKENRDKDLGLDERQRYELGVMQQMQIYTFMDIPYGPYHRKYKTDRKKFSNKQEVKYKINVRPS